MDLRMLIPVMGILLVMIPVAGLTLTLLVRFALKPLVESLAQAIRDSGMSRGAVLGREDMLQLTEQVQALTEEVERLREIGEFDKKLVTGAD